MYTCNNNQGKRGYEFEGEWEKYTGGFGERKEKGEMF